MHVDKNSTMKMMIVVDWEIRELTVENHSLNHLVEVECRMMNYLPFFVWLCVHRNRFVFENEITCNRFSWFNIPIEQYVSLSCSSLLTNRNEWEGNRKENFMPMEQVEKNKLFVWLFSFKLGVVSVGYLLALVFNTLDTSDTKSLCHWLVSIMISLLRAYK